MIPLTVPETRRLLSLGGAPPEQQRRGLHWSRWRRTHQATAKRCHAARRARRAGAPRAATQTTTVPGTPSLTDALWTHLALLLPPRAGKRGRTPSDHRPILAGLLWMMRTGVGWREIPPSFGPWHTVYSRYQQWCRDGTWARIVAALPPTHEEDQLSL
jgi:hypothetical protein